LTSASNAPCKLQVPAADRVLGLLNGFVAVSAIVIAAIPIGLTAAFLFVWLVCTVEGLFSGETMRLGTLVGDGPGMAGGGAGGGALFLIALLISAVASLVVVVPFGTWLYCIARWLRRGDPRGRGQLWWCNWTALGATAVLWLFAAAVAHDPIAKNVFATPVILWATANLIVLRRVRGGCEQCG